MKLADLLLGRMLGGGSAVVGYTVELEPQVPSAVWPAYRAALDDALREGAGYLRLTSHRAERIDPEDVYVRSPKA